MAVLIALTKLTSDFDLLQTQHESHAVQCVRFYSQWAWRHLGYDDRAWGVALDKRTSWEQI